MPNTSELIIANIREINKLYRAAHDSAFKFSWKRLWPFSRFLPQVDYLRLIRLIQSAIAELDKQKNAALKYQKQNSAENSFWKATLQWCHAQETTIQLLQEVCEYRQSVIEGEKSKGLGDWNQLLKNYQESLKVLQEQGQKLNTELVALRKKNA